MLLCWHLLPTWHQPLHCDPGPETAAIVPASHLRLVHSKHPCCLAVRRGACNPCSGRLRCNPSAQLGLPVLPASVDTAAELSGERQGESSTPRQSHCHVGCLASSAADIIGRLADGRRRHPGGCGSASQRQSVRATHVHVRCPCGCPWHARVGLQEKRRTSPPPRLAQRRRVACNAACPGPVLQGTSRTQQVRREASRRGLADPVVTRPLCDLGRQVP